MAWNSSETCTCDENAFRTGALHPHVIPSRRSICANTTRDRRTPMKKILMPLLLLSAAFVTPTYANYFSNPRTGITLNVGSAPNPTPDDIRENRVPMVADAPVPAANAQADAKKVPDTHQVAVGDGKHNSASP